MIRKSTEIMSDDKFYVIYLAVIWAVLTVVMSNLMFSG